MPQGISAGGQCAPREREHIEEGDVAGHRAHAGRELERTGSSHREELDS